MKYAAASLLALLIAATPACERGEPPHDVPAGARAAAPDTARTASAEPTGAPESASVIYLDVRTPAEFADGHVHGTLHIPIDDLGRRWQELEPYRDRQIVVYCRSGRRAATAIDLLAARGFSRLENGGGLTDMAARGLTIAR